MDVNQTAQQLDRLGIPVPKLVCLKETLKKSEKSTQRNLLLARANIRRGRATWQADAEIDSFIHMIDVATGAVHSEKFGAWALYSLAKICNQLLILAEKAPVLARVLCEQAQMEVYGAGTDSFSAYLVPKNAAIKLHADTLDETPNLMACMAGQYLDYAFATGVRRFSTSALFDLCFNAEKVICPKGLAVCIDAELEKTGIYKAERHEVSAHEHAKNLLNGGAPALNNAYARVLMRERFAHMICHYYGQLKQPIKAPLLDHYRMLVALDLKVQGQADASFPPKELDVLQQALHVPVMSIFKGDSDAATH